MWWGAGCESRPAASSASRHTYSNEAVPLLDMPRARAYHQTVVIGPELLPRFMFWSWKIFFYKKMFPAGQT